MSKSAIRMHGLMLINKPVGITSHDVVARVRKLLGTREVGHSGTLDPMAGGLMVLLIGEATKLSQYVTEGDKSYQVGVKLGITTDTQDITGTVTSEKTVQISNESLKKIAFSLAGDFNLSIPMYSAKKIDGQKLYEYARSGEQVDVPYKVMKFWNIQDVESSQDHHPQFHLHCSKGSFVRSWVSLLGEKLGCGATMASLIRTSSHQFHIDQAITLDYLEQLSYEERIRTLIPLDQALKNVKKIRIRGQDEALMKNGQISHNLRLNLISQCQPHVDQIVQILPSDRGQLLALIGLEPQSGFKIKRVFKY